MNIDLRALCLKELKDLQESIQSEIASRRAKPELVIYTHNCKDSANHHRSKYKHWAKLVTGIDTSKTNGYAFAGDFLKIEYEHKIPSGSLVVEVCHEKIYAYTVTADGKTKIGEAYTTSMSELIAQLAEVLSNGKG